MCTLIDRFDEHDGRSLIQVVCASDLRTCVCMYASVWGGGDYVVNTFVWGCGCEGRKCGVVVHCTLYMYICMCIGGTRGIG